MLVFCYFYILLKCMCVSLNCELPVSARWAGQQALRIPLSLFYSPSTGVPMHTTILDFYEVLRTKPRSSCPCNKHFTKPFSQLLKHVFLSFILRQCFPCRPGWCGACYVDQAGCKLKRDPTSSASQVLGLEVCGTIPSSLKDIF